MLDIYAPLCQSFLLLEAFAEFDVQVTVHVINSYNKTN